MTWSDVEETSLGTDFGISGTNFLTSIKIAPAEISSSTMQAAKGLFVVRKIMQRY